MAGETQLITTAVPGPGTTGAAVTFAAADATNGNYFVSTGKEFCIVHNTDSGAHNFTVTSQPDERKRLGDFVKAVPATSFILTPRFQMPGFATNKQVLLPNTNDATLAIAVIYP